MKIKWKQVAMFAGAGALFALVANLILKPDTIDWVNVALVPELAAELGVDVATRLELAYIGFVALDEIAGPPGTETAAGKQADRYGLAVLRHHGQQVFDLLTVPQRKKFYLMFRERKVVPVTYRTEPPPGGSGPALFQVEFGWKARPASMRTPLPETAEQLALVWQIIPSKLTAESLLDHESTAVRDAATVWLAANMPPPQKKMQRKLSGPYAEDKWDRHERKMAESRKRFDRWERERENRPSYEERVAQMHKRHEERVRAMKEKQRQQ